jgi:hypothetical protein
MTYRLKNNDGASVNINALAVERKAYGGNPRPRIVYLDMYAAGTAVKAILASLRQQNRVLFIDGWGSGAPRRMGPHDQGYYIREGTLLGYFRRVTVMATTQPGDEFGYALSVFSDDIETQIQRLIELYTPYPALPSWKHELYEHGYRSGMIHDLWVTGMQQGKAVAMDTWGDVIDELAKANRLPYL